MGRPSDRGFAAVEQWLDSEGQTELARLVRALQVGRRQASLIIVRCNEPELRAYLYDELARRLDGLRIQAIQAIPDQPDLPRWLIEVVQPETDVVFVSNLEPAIPAVLTYLNYRRETLLRLNRPVVIWAGEWGVQEMIRHAPDFWAFRRHLFEFIPARAALERLAVQMLEGADGVYVSAEELADRIALHRALIADMEAKGMGKNALAAGLRRDLGSLLWHAGEWAEAEAILAEAVDLFRNLGDRQREAGTLHQIGIVHQARGDYDAALEYYRRSLEMLEQLGDRAGAASSLGQIGQVAQLQGDYVTAVRLWVQALATFEALGMPERDIVLRWFARLREELGAERFEGVLREAGLIAPP